MMQICFTLCFFSGLDIAVYIHLEKQQKCIFINVNVGDSLIDE